MPVLRDVGDGWERGELGVLHEHFVSSTFRGVLGGLRMPVQGERVRTVVLACPPRELHDLPLELFGAMLHARSWRVVGLGANTPMTAIADAVRHLDADACVIAGVRRSAFESRVSALRRLGERVPMFLAGEGALALATAPRGTTVLPARPAGRGRPGRRSRVRGRRHPGGRPQRARGRLTGIRWVHADHPPRTRLPPRRDGRHPGARRPGHLRRRPERGARPRGRARDAPAPRPPRPRAAARPWSPPTPTRSCCATPAASTCSPASGSRRARTTAPPAPSARSR